MASAKPPFRADHVGSFLRPAALKDARAKREQGRITPAELTAVEDREIENVIKRQEEIGLKLATDGEFRRSWWHFDFLGRLDGVKAFDQAVAFQGVQARAQNLRIVGKVGFSGHPFLEHFRFVQAHAKVTPKLTIPAPPVLHFRLAKDGIDRNVYPDLDGFFADLGETYKTAVRAFYDAGCRYLQFDDTIWAYLCSPEELRKARERMSMDVDALQDIYAQVINTALAAKPADMTITTHVCRGNFRSTWISEGGYEPVAETLFGDVDYDGYFLEYDSERAGGFEPLRFLPKGKKRVVLGLVTSKSGALEQKDTIRRQIEEAAKFANLDQFCLSPQCGFASTEEGNILAEEEQWAKLRMIVELADECGASKSMAARTKPPFRADHVGSLLRPPALKDARGKRAKGEITAEQLKEIEDREIEKAIKKQEEIGLELATDGEFRRSWWQFDFFKGLDGAELYSTGQGIKFAGVETKAESIRVVGKVGFSTHPHLEHFRFVKDHAKVTPKMTIPAPSTLHFRQGRQSISKEVYPDLDAYFHDVAQAYRKAIRAFYDAGCRYLQLDDTAWSMICDPKEQEGSRKRGDDPGALPEKYVRVTNEALAGRPADMVVTMHTCRGNFRSTFIASGGYEHVAERFLGEVDIDGYFLEYDSERAGGFEPLRFVPKGKKQVVLGLVTSKSGTLESKDAIKRRIDEATKYVALDQLCLSPQCGFASTEEGNTLAQDEQWAKLTMIVELAEDVWGKA